jgi:hypothetical protein
VSGLTDRTTIGQLVGILSEIDSRGRLKIQSKEEAAKRGVPSPDRAEALMLALGELPAEYSYTSVETFREHRLLPSEQQERDQAGDLAGLGRLRSLNQLGRITNRGKFRGF